MDGDKKPTEKWDVPLSTSQDIGWLISNPVRAATLGQWHVPPGPEDKKRKPKTTAPEPPRAIVIPANEHMVERSRSAPELPQGPPLNSLSRTNNPRWSRPMRSYDITKYAD